MTKPAASLPTATETAADAPCRNGHRFVLQKMDTYPV